MEIPQLVQVGIYQGESASPGDIEARVFYDAILKGKSLVVEAKQALVVSKFSYHL